MQDTIKKIATNNEIIGRQKMLLAIIHWRNQCLDEYGSFDKDDLQFFIETESNRLNFEIERSKDD